ncbi:SDR family NAD(P)-dependent oxidoreductase [Niastella caeni]|uniref:SDR family NAD(P)-dependent oxidoreductase n=1 Tax=Niastella caeni TaxID=2569763 RepID=A0A4V4H1S6_9BACT|nr:SDR family NAD(P)-dependent oxidoreductase [Niastella caeni]THU41646.1 SDR family NAD(P)-dependent oxidoreductase [Niastella caeni]
MFTKILVTGGSGFIGAYIIKELVEKGYAVRAIRHSKAAPFFIPEHVNAKVEWVHGDVLDVVSLHEAMNGVDAVIHSAAKVSFGDKERSALYKINIEGTANVVNMALENNVQRFVHISSVAAIGRTVTGETITEEKKWQPGKMHTSYAISKYHAELEVWRAAAESLNTVIVNPSTVLGYGDWSTSSCAIFKSVYNEFPWYTKGINGFVAVTDVARAAVLLMESDHTNERFIVSGDNWSFQQLLNTIADGFGKKHPHKEATPFLGKIAWRMEKLKSMFSGKKPLLTRESARVAQSITYFDNSKLLKSLPGFSFTPLEKAIQKDCEQYLARLQPL